MPPITRLRNPSSGGPAILTHSMDIDKLMRQTMGAIYQGNVPDSWQDKRLSTFLHKFGQFFQQAEPFSVRDLQWHHLQEAIKRMPDNTPGVDGVRKSDRLLLSPNALWLLTQLGKVFLRYGHVTIPHRFLYWFRLTQWRAPELFVLEHTAKVLVWCFEL